jgi:GT2 family glycosyltransferase/glycosyltransferase involved in cell wall biosynthesis
MPVNSSARSASAPVDIVVPVYNAADELSRCVESVLEHSTGDWRLVLIDDGSPDPAVRSLFGRLEARKLPRLVLASNRRNLGFTLTANRGMREARPDADVVLLNSDTVVTRGWLAALSRCAASAADVGTITPFSNNAEICSLPRFCANNLWPAGEDPASLVEALERSAVPVYPELPTGVGFCLYIRHALIDAIGVFDPAFGLGYGEENDYCMRAVAAGFRNLLCEDAFVLHLGGSSFGDKRADLAARNTALLLERHAGYEALVRDYIAADPVKPLRELALAQHRALNRDRPGVLHVVHGHGGGTEYHVRALIAALSVPFRHYLLIAVNDQWQLEEHSEGETLSFDFRRGPSEAWPDFLGGLAARFGIDLVHLHNISGCREGLMAALEGLALPYGYTVHDLNFACPTITFTDPRDRYCGAVTDLATCGACLEAQSEYAGVDIAVWRERHRALLARAAFVIAPSQWAASTLRRYFADPAVAIIPHGSAKGMPRDDGVRSRLELPEDDVPTVAVIGAIGPDKGARRIERLVELTRARGLRLRWVVVGYLDRGREQWQSEDAVFTQHGPFDSREITELLGHYRVRLVAYPSAGPETFSFTLSEAWAAGLPAVVPPIGALAERVAATGGGWVLSESEWQDEARMLDRIAALLDPAQAGTWAEAAARARRSPQPTLAAMAAATSAVYGDALTRQTARIAQAPLSPQRCLDALGYRAWHWPRSAGANGARASSGALTLIARTALSFRHTLAGRVLYRIAPKPLLDALRHRL